MKEKYKEGTFFKKNILENGKIEFHKKYFQNQGLEVAEKALENK